MIFKEKMYQSDLTHYRRQSYQSFGIVLILHCDNDNAINIGSEIEETSIDIVFVDVHLKYALCLT